MTNNDETSKQIKLLHLKVKQLLSEGWTDENIINELAKEGIQTHYAQTIIENLQDEESDKKSFRNSLLVGIFYIVAGILINFFSYKIAVNNNSFFFYLFWGIIVLGIVTIIRGFILYKK